MQCADFFIAKFQLDKNLFKKNSPIVEEFYKFIQR
jgi:hypothetical protein